MKYIKLGELCNIVSGGTPSRTKSEYWNNGTIPWIKIGNIKSKYVNEADEFITEKGLQFSSAKLLPKGTLLYTIFATLGECGILGIEACTNQAIAGLTIKEPENIFSEYIYYFLKSKKNDVTFLGRGVAQNNINLSMLRNFLVPVPSLTVQNAIINLLAKAECVIKLRKNELELLDNLIKARFVEVTKSSTTEPTRMGDVASYINGYAFKPSDWQQNGIPIIRIQNLNDKNATYNHFNGTINEKYRVRNGDVLVSWATHLEAYIWNGGDAWLNQHIFRVVFDKIPINKTYFVYSTEEALRQAFKNAHGFKPTMEHIKRSDFENAIINLPPVAIQEQFANFVAQIDKSKVMKRLRLSTISFC